MQDNEGIAVKTAVSEEIKKPLSAEYLQKMHAYWRAANYLSVGQIYLYDNPLLKKPLTLSHVKPLVVGHWGTTPGQNFIYVHLNRVIRKYDLNLIGDACSSLVRLAKSKGKTLVIENLDFSKKKATLKDEEDPN